MKLEEFAPSSNDKEQLNEILPAIAIGAGLIWSAYDAWKMKKAYDRGEISQADMVKAVGTDVGLTLAGGAVLKVAGKGWKYGKNIYKDKKSAKKAERDDVKKTVKDKKVKPLTKRETKELEKLEKKIQKQRREAFGIKTDSKLEKTGSIARKIVAPFGSNAPVLTKADKKIRKIHKKKQKEIAKQKKLDDAPVQRDKLEKLRAEVNKNPKQKEAERIETNTARAKEKAEREAARKAENKRQADALGKKHEIDDYNRAWDEVSDIVKSNRGLDQIPRVGGQTSIQYRKSLDAANKVVQRATSKQIKGTAHAMDAGKAISAGTKTGTKTAKDAVISRAASTPVRGSAIPGSAIRRVQNKVSGYKSINSLQKAAEREYHAGEKLKNIVAAGPKVK